MPRTLKLLLLLPALAVPLGAPPAARAGPQTAAAVQSDSREAIQTLVRAVEGEKKKDAETWFRLGIEYHRAGDVGAARAAFRRALKLSPGFNAARAGLAYTFFVEKNFAEAEREAYRANSGFTTNFTAYNVLAAIRSQRYREAAVGALAQAEQALANDPDAPDWNLLKAEALIGLSPPSPRPRRPTTPL
jgi:Flp pilus assembly protein TadD